MLPLWSSLHVFESRFLWCPQISNTFILILSIECFLWFFKKGKAFSLFSIIFSSFSNEYNQHPLKTNKKTPLHYNFSKQKLFTLKKAITMFSFIICFFKKIDGLSSEPLILILSHMLIFILIWSHKEFNQWNSIYYLRCLTCSCYQKYKWADLLFPANKTDWKS